MQEELTTSRVIRIRAFNSTYRIVLTALFASLAISLRLFKHAIIGPIQIINLPAVFTIFAGLLLGSVSGISVGLISFIVSDLFLGFGPWTFVTATFMALIGGIFGLLGGKVTNRPQLFILIVVLLFINDVMTSTILYMVMGFSFQFALIYSILGLFLPIQGGFMFGIGPITEISSALLVTLSLPLIQNSINQVM
ncbi:MAG: ECF transporter S component [Candidatus Odinarchaeia archaeon]